MSLQTLLSQYYCPTGPERVGFILADGTVVEVKNISAKPESSFDVSGEDLVKYAEEAQGSWHTHPGAGANLSMDDHKAFLSHPKLTHHIVGDDGVKSFIVNGGMVWHAP